LKFVGKLGGGEGELGGGSEGQLVGGREGELGGGRGELSAASGREG
jgi:hypothetical protein